MGFYYGMSFGDSPKEVILYCHAELSLMLSLGALVFVVVLTEIHPLCHSAGLIM